MTVRPNGAAGAPAEQPLTPATSAWPIAGERLGRPLPIPWWFLPVHVVLPRRAKEAIRRMMGYARLEPA